MELYDILKAGRDDISEDNTVRVILDKYNRLQSDFNNYRGRVDRLVNDKEIEIKSDSMAGMMSLNALLHNFIGATVNQKSSLEDILCGILEIIKYSDRELLKFGIEPIKAVGEKFNPKYHECVEYTDNSLYFDSGDITEELERGYKLGDKVLVPSKVRVVR